MTKSQGNFLYTNMTKDFIIAIGLFTSLTTSLFTNIYLFRRLEKMYATQEFMMEIIKEQQLEIQVRKIACDAP